MVPEDRTEGFLVRALRNVVALLEESGLGLGEHLVDVQARPEQPYERGANLRTLEIGADGRLDLAVPHFDRHLGAVRKPGAVDLADRRRRCRAGVHPRQEEVRLGSEILAQGLLDIAKRNGL